jgi:hypothetical protein
MTGHELVPGQTLKDIEMLDDHIKYFQRQAGKRFGRPRIGPNGVVIPAALLPKHPVEILDIRPVTPQTEAQAQAAAQAVQDQADQEAERAEHTDGDGGETRPRTRRR